MLGRPRWSLVWSASAARSSSSGAALDLPDLIATAGTGQARAVVVSADLRRLDGEALARLAAAQVAVVGLVDPGDESAMRRLRQLGVAEVLPADSPPEQVAEAVARAVADAEARAAREPGPVAAGAPAGAAAELGLADPARALPALPDLAPTEPDRTDSPAGRLVAVWGPTGAPGRTTVAVTLAAELAALGRETILADADTYGGSVAQVLGLLDEAPGLAAAARGSDHGTLDLSLSLARRRRSSFRAAGAHRHRAPCVGRSSGRPRSAGSSSWPGCCAPGRSSTAASPGNRTRS